MLLNIFTLSLHISSVDSVSVNYIPETGTPPSARIYPAFALDSKSQKLYTYGGRSDTTLSDMWEFDLNSKLWSEIHPGSVLTPGSRSNAFMTALEDQKKLVLFGGEIVSGPASDVWLFDIKNESWKLIDDKGQLPTRAYSRAVCDYIYEGKHYIAVYGGQAKGYVVKSLFILDLETFIWTELAGIENAPEVVGHQMRYYKGALYIWAGLYIFKYELGATKWVIIEPSENNRRYFGFNSICIYKDNLYSIFGLDYESASPTHEILKLSILDIQYQIEIVTEKQDLANWALGYVCKDNLIYLFGGGYLKGLHNSLARIDLDTSELRVTTFSKNNLFPISRGGHIMEVYNDEVYLFGGKDSQGN